MVRFRTPSGNFVLKFLGSDNLAAVNYSLEARGFAPGTYRLRTYQSTSEVIIEDLTQH